MPFTLLGKRILVVEDDYMLATDICRGLSDLGATVLGPAPTPFYALGLLGRRGVDAAILDVHLHGTDVFDVADELIARNIPIVFATASGWADIPEPYQRFPHLQKPTEPEALHDVLSKVLLAPRVEKRAPNAIAPDTAEDQLMRVIIRAMRLE